MSGREVQRLEIYPLENAGGLFEIRRREWEKDSVFKRGLHFYFTNHKQPENQAREKNYNHALMPTLVYTEIVRQIFTANTLYALYLFLWVVNSVSGREH